MVQTGSTTGLGPAGRRFKSCLGDHFIEDCQSWSIGLVLKTREGFHSSVRSNRTSSARETWPNWSRQHLAKMPKPQRASGSSSLPVSATISISIKSQRLFLSSIRTSPLLHGKYSPTENVEEGRILQESCSSKLLLTNPLQLL